MFAQLISLLLFLCVVHIDCFYTRADSVSYYRNICQNMKPEDMVRYVSSFKDYTIISDNDNNKDLEDFMIQNNIQTYYFNVDNLLNKGEIIEYLLRNSNNYDSGENLWIFHRGFLFGSSEDVYNLIKKIRLLNKEEY
jgi:hypothetical protein